MSVGIAAFGKIRQIVHHLLRQRIILVFHEPPAFVQRTKPVPQVAAVDGTPPVIRMFPFEEPCEAAAFSLSGLVGAIVPCHPGQLAADDIPAGRTQHIRNIFLFSGPELLNGIGIDKRTVNAGAAMLPYRLFPFCCYLPCLDQIFRAQLAQLL